MPYIAMIRTHLTRAVAAALVLATGAGSAPLAHGQTGGAAVVFLMIEPDSRAAGMGNSNVAIADNAYATFWNPAGLAYQTGTEVAVTHSEWLPEFDAGLYYEALVAKHRVEGLGTFGGHVTYLNLGEHEYRTSTGEEVGTFRSGDLAIGASYGFKATKNLAFGLAGRFIYSSLAGRSFGEGGAEIDTKPGKSLGVDVGALYRSRPIDLGGSDLTVSAGFNLANMGPTISYTETSIGDPIPTNLRFGYSLKLDLDEYNSFTLSNDFSKMLTRIRVDSTGGETTVEADPFYKAIFSAWAPIRVNSGASTDSTEFREVGVLDQLIIGLGAEYWYNKLFAARAGYFYESPYNGNRQFLTFGAGVRYSIAGVDFSYIYALEENHPLANTMRFSLLLNFGK